MMNEFSDKQGQAPIESPSSVLESFERIVEAAENSRLSEEFFEKNSGCIQYASDKLGVTPVQAVVLALFVDRSEDSDIKLSDIASYTGCHTTRIIRFSSEIEALRDKGYVRIILDAGNTSYRLPYYVLNALKEDRPYVREKVPIPDLDTFFQKFGELIDEMSDGEKSHKELIEATNDLLDAIKDFQFFKKLNKLILENESVLLFIHMAYLYVENEDDRIGLYDIRYLYDNRKIPSRIKYELHYCTMDLFRENLIENSNEDGMAASDSYKLTDFAKTEMLSELKRPFVNKSLRNLILSSSFPEKELIYNTSERMQVQKLSSLLLPDRFKEIQARLVAAGMRKGVCCLFYGSPGTGKTETVYQLARASRRDILRVDVDKIKSCWVGQSEQNIKKAFTDYRNICRKSDIAPILLFNEADAVLGARLEGATRSVDKMENSIQNIILQEMESLEGILIATTNLTCNLDDAFERRFLYKIQFCRPTTESRAKIWKAMIPSLSDNDAQTLAIRFNLSGGEIENISRKHAINSILSGQDNTDLSSIIEICNNERIVRPEARSRIGFCRES